MTAHPSLLVVLALDLGALLLLAGSTLTALRVALRWAPAAAGASQLALEARYETASLQGRAAALSFLLASLTLLVAVSAALPSLVPGAMCGTGVLQALAGSGERALWLRGMALGLLGLWLVVDRLDRSHPESPLAPLSCRLMLLLFPVALLAVLAWAGAVAAMDLHRPVDCCAALYDGAGAGMTAGALARPATAVWLPAAAAAMVPLLGLGLWRWRATGPLPAHLDALLGVLALTWVALAWQALLSALAPYHYQVLSHRCPWCLFLAQHGLVGYPLVLALAAVALEGPAAWLSTRISAREPRLAQAGAQRARRAGAHLVVATLLFAALAAGPALLWRVRFGVWMH